MRQISFVISVLLILVLRLNVSSAEEFVPLSLVFKKHDVDSEEPMRNTTFKITDSRHEDVTGIFQCDEISDSEGKANCQFKCVSSSGFIKSYILVPKYYSDYNVQKSYFIRLKGCSLTPNKVVVNYMHWRVMANNYENNYFELINSNGYLKTISDSEPASEDAKNAIRELAKQEDGAGVLLEARKQWSNLAVINRRLGNEKEVVRYSGYSVLAANVMLHNVAQSFSEKSRTNVEISPNLSVYFKNLDSTLIAVKEGDKKTISEQEQQQAVEILHRVRTKGMLNEDQFRGIESIYQGQLLTSGRDRN